MKKLWLLVMVLLVSWGLSGCASSTMRHVQSVDSSQESVKFLYNQQTADGEWERGIIKCDLQDELLTNCRQVEVEYR